MGVTVSPENIIAKMLAAQENWNPVKDMVGGLSAG